MCSVSDLMIGWQDDPPGLPLVRGLSVESPFLPRTKDNCRLIYPFQTPNIPGSLDVVPLCPWAPTEWEAELATGSPCRMLACLDAMNSFIKISVTYLFFLFLIHITLFTYFSLHWVFVAARGLSLVAASGDVSSLRCAGFSLRWLLLQSTSSLSANSAVRLLGSRVRTQ